MCDQCEKNPKLTGKQLPMSGHIVYRIEAAIRCGLLADKSSNLQIWSAIGDGRFIHAARAYLDNQVKAGRSG